MFINRKKELNFLEDKWQQNVAQLIVLWGKRRVGKTELVKQFIQDKPHIYFLAQTTHEKEQLRLFSEMIGQFFDEPLLRTRGFSSWEESFQFIKAKNKKFILAIDEFPYLILSNSAIPAIFQKAWDEYFKDSPIYLILLGSSIAMMETEVLGYRAPLYGRRTGQWKISPFSFLEASLFRKNQSFDDKVAHYSLAGGIPAYWLKFDQEKDFFSNLEHSVLQKGEFLYDEVEFLLREELREPRYYFSLLQAISHGKRKLSEIVNATGLSQSVANKYLSVLIDLDIIERETPVTEEKPLKSKKGLYRIKDLFFQFWFHYVFPKRYQIEMGQIATIIEEIKLNFSQYLGFIYEEIAKELLMNYQPQLFSFDAIGRWWDKTEEIDIVAYNKKENRILFAEVKWQNEPIGIAVFQNLLEKSQKVLFGNQKTQKHFILFSRSGFTDELIQKANQESILLIQKDQFIR